MKRVSFLIFFFILLTSITYAEFRSGDYCYQEFANVSTSCGGLSSGTYSTGGTVNWALDENYLWDGNWSTKADTTGIGVSYLYINYTKPDNVHNVGTLWEIKDGTGQTNLSIPNHCWTKNSTTLFFRVESGAKLLLTTHWNRWWCLNSTDWHSIRYNAGGGEVHFWGDIYEEGIYWNLTEIKLNANYTTPLIPLFGSNVTLSINATRENSSIIYSNFSLTHVNESEQVNSYDCLGNITAATCANGVDGDWLSYAFPDSYYASAYILVNQTLGKNLTGANITVRGATPTSYYSGVNVTFCFNSSDEWEIVIPTVNTNYLTLLSYPLPSSCLTNETLQLKFGVRSAGMLGGESFKFYGFKVEQFILKINNSNGTRNGDLWVSDLHQIDDNGTYFYNVSISDGLIEKNISRTVIITDNKAITPNYYIQVKQPSESLAFNITLITNNANLEWNITSINGFANNITIDGLGIINFSGNHTHQLNLTVNATAGTHLHQDTLTITRLLDGYNETIELNITVSLNAGNIYLINDDNYIDASFSSTETKTKTWLLNNTGDYNLSDCLCDINGDFTGRSFFAFNESNFNISINQTKNITLAITNPLPVSTYTGLLQCECNATLLGDKDSLEPSNQPTISITVIEGVTPITPGGGGGGGGGISEVEPRFDVLAERSLQLRYYQQEDTNKSRGYIFTNLHTSVLEVKLFCQSVGNYCDFVFIPNSTLYLQPNILQPFIMDITTYLPINYTNESITFSIISRDEFGGEIKIDTEVIVSGRIFTLGTLFTKFKQFYQVGKLNIPKAVPIVFLTGFLTSFVYILSRKLTAQYALTFIGFFISMFISLLLIP